MKSPKAELRQQLRMRRRGLSADQQIQAAQQTANVAQGLSGFLAAEHIALYLARDGELSPEYLLQHCHQAGKSCYLPVVGDNKTMQFARYSPGARLQANQYGILEPLECAPRIAGPELDWVFMPLVGFNRSGARLGMGGGYYDRAFEFVNKAGTAKPQLVGLAHSVQEIAEGKDFNIDSWQQAWDIPLNYIVSERELIKI